MTDSTTYLPGRELSDPHVRKIVERYVRELGCRYDPTHKHSRLYHPTLNVFCTFPKTPSDWRGRLNMLSDMRRVLGELPESPALRRSVRPQVSDEPVTYDVAETHWTESEWRERQRGEVWWREQAYAPPQADEPEQPTEPERPQVSGYIAGFLSRLDGADSVRPDAQGNGRWTLAAARQMLRDGYGLEHVITTTGWGHLWLADLAERLATG